MVKIRYILPDQPAIRHDTCLSAEGRLSGTAAASSEEGSEAWAGRTSIMEVGSQGTPPLAVTETLRVETGELHDARLQWEEVV